MVLLSGHRGYGYQHRSGRQDTAQLSEYGRAVQQPACDKGVRHHILGSVVPRYKGREESEDDLAEDLCDLPRRSCTLLYELVVARSAVLANCEYGNLYGYYDCRIYPPSYVGSMD